MNIKKIKAFTLVELIVIVTILAVLSTIWFISYSSYLSGVRDTNRVSNMKALSDGLEMYRNEHNLPLPENSIEIRENWELVARQWDAWENVLETIEFSNGWIDPQNGEYISYYLTKDKKYYQLMVFLEWNLSDLSFNILNKARAIDYSSKNPIVLGKKLWILTDDYNTPVHKIPEVINNWFIDIWTWTWVYIAHFKENWNLKWDIQDLWVVSELAQNWWKPNSCLTWVLMNPELNWWDWNYQITDINKNSYEWYCDWTWDTPIPEDGWADYELISSWAIINWTFSWWTDIPTETWSIDTNNIIEMPSDELPEEMIEDWSDHWYVLEQEWDDSDYKIEIEDTDTDWDWKTEKQEFEELWEWDVVKLCWWVNNLDNDWYVFNNIVEYIDGKKSYNWKVINMFEKEKKGKKWTYQCIEHKLIWQPKDFLWRIWYKAEEFNKKFYIWWIEVKFYKKK